MTTQKIYEDNADSLVDSPGGDVTYLGFDDEDSYFFYNNDNWATYSGISNAKSFAFFLDDSTYSAYEWDDPFNVQNNNDFVDGSGFGPWAYSPYYIAVGWPTDATDIDDVEDLKSEYIFNSDTIPDDVADLGTIDTDDTVTGSYEHDSIYLGPGDDVIDGDHHSDTLVGGSDDDSIKGGSGSDLIYGDYADAPDIAAFGQSDTDGLNYEFSWKLPDEDTSITGADTLDGGDDGDTLYGGNGNDILYGGPRGDGDSDMLVGGDGSDLFYLEYNSDDDDSSTNYWDSFVSNWGEGAGTTVISTSIKDLEEASASQILGSLVTNIILDGAVGALTTTVIDIFENVFSSTSASDESEDVMVVTDFDPRYDALYLPVDDGTTLDVTAAYYSSSAVSGVDGYGAKFTSADTNSVFAEVFFDDDFLDEFDITSSSTAVTEFLENIFSASVTFDDDDSDDSELSSNYVFTDDVSDEFDFVASNGTSANIFGAFGPMVLYGPSISTGTSYMSGTMYGDYLSVNSSAFDPADGFSSQLSTLPSLMKGFEGDDYLIGGNGQDYIYGGDGDDILYLYGTATSSAGESEEQAYGEDGDDTIYAGLTYADIDGGDGTDMVDFSLSTVGVIVDLDGGTGEDYGTDANSDNVYSFTDVESINGTDYDDSLYGAGDDTTDGYEINGNGGDDTIQGGTAEGTLDGGDDVDILDLSNYITYDTSTFLLDTSLTELTSTSDKISSFTLGDDGDGTFSNWIANDETYTVPGTYDVDTLVPSDLDDDEAIILDDFYTEKVTTYQNFEGVSGTDNDDKITANDDGNILFGQDGDDTLTGGDGDDTIDGGPGNDSISGGAGDDALSWSLYDEDEFDSDDADTIDGGDDDDTLYIDADDGTSGTETDVEVVDDTSGTVTIAAGDAGVSATNIEYISLTSDDDGSNIALTGDLPSNAHLNTRSSTPPQRSGIVINLDANRGRQTVDGTTWRDSVILTAGSEEDTLLAGAYEDTLDGGSGDDLIDAGGGRDLVMGGSGTDTLIGGDDDDTIVGGAGDDQLSGQGGADSLSGGAGEDTLGGGARADVVDGDAGNDTLRGGGGYDDMDGGAGEDVLVGHEGNDTMSGGAGVDALAAGAGADHAKGGSGDDVVAGDAGGDLLEGQGGADRLVGGSGSDTLHGGREDDTLHGNADDDAIRGGGGDDIADGGRGDDEIFGEGGEDRLFGGHGDDALIGGRGNDIADGSHGDDSLFGGEGADSLRGEDGADTIIAGSGADIMSGGDGDDVVVGGDGRDTLFGNDGEDRLVGGLGADQMRGGAGADRFVLAFAELNGDLITDFDADEGDVIVVKGAPDAEIIFGENGLITVELEGSAASFTAEGASRDDLVLL